jgi:hypothetical protein
MAPIAMNHTYVIQGVYFIIFLIMAAYHRESLYLRTRPVTAAVVRETVKETLCTTLFGLGTCNSDLFL